MKLFQAASSQNVVDMFTTIMQWILSAIGGALVVLVAFRTRMVRMNDRIDTRGREIADLEKRILARIGLMEKRQMLTLEIMADVARKVGVDSRFSDRIVRFLMADEAEQPQGRFDETRENDERAVDVRRE